MNRTRTHMFSWMLAPALVLPAVVSAQCSPTFKQEELDQMLAPVALYPDSLRSQILMASTYPLEVVQAARWATQNKALKGDALAAALEKQEWDPSVKPLVNFPQILQMMNDKLDWTQKLGDAFLAQEKEVMGAIQRLRAKAYAEGNLKTTKEQTVIVEKDPQTIIIEPANPQVVYVPTYNPTLVYGVWAYPATYGSSGIMTFVVNHDGIVYQKDLGKKTEGIVAKMTLFNPDKTWKKVDVAAGTPGPSGS